MPKVIVERRETVLEIALNRPEVLNAVDRETIAALAAAAAEAAEDKAVRAVLLRGEGTHFCAGGDIGMFADLIRLPSEERRKLLYQIVDGLLPLLVRLRHMPKPVVAAVQGGSRVRAQLGARRRSRSCCRGCRVCVRLYPSRH